MYCMVVYHSRIQLDTMCYSCKVDRDPVRCNLLLYCVQCTVYSVTMCSIDPPLLCSILCKYIVACIIFTHVYLC